MSKTDKIKQKKIFEKMETLFHEPVFGLSEIDSLTKKSKKELEEKLKHIG